MHGAALVKRSASSEDLHARLSRLHLLSAATTQHQEAAAAAPVAALAPGRQGDAAGALLAVNLSDLHPLPCNAPLGVALLAPSSSAMTTIAAASPPALFAAGAGGGKEERVEAPAGTLRVGAGLGQEEESGRTWAAQAPGDEALGTAGDDTQEEEEEEEEEGQEDAAAHAVHVGLSSPSACRSWHSTWEEGEGGGGRGSVAGGAAPPSREPHELA